MAVRRKIACAAAATTAAVVTLAACTSTPATEIGSTPDTTSPTTTAPAVAGPTNLADVILSVTDLPTGWTSTTDKTAASLGQAGCLKAASGRVGTKSERYATFAGAGGSPIFAESLAYVGATGAASTYAAGVKELNSCPKIQITAGKVTFAGPLQATSFPVVGTQSQAYTLTATSGAHVLTEYILIAQEPDIVMMTSYASVKDGSITDFLSLSSKASSKLNP